MLYLLLSRNLVSWERSQDLCVCRILHGSHWMQAGPYNSSEFILYGSSITKWRLPRSGLNWVVLVHTGSRMCRRPWPKPHCCEWLGTEEPGGMQQRSCSPSDKQIRTPCGTPAVPVAQSSLPHRSDSDKSNSVAFSRSLLKSCKKCKQCCVANLLCS